MKQVLSDDYEVLKGHAGSYRPWCKSPYHPAITYHLGPQCLELADDAVQQVLLLPSPFVTSPRTGRVDTFMEMYPLLLLPSSAEHAKLFMCLRVEGLKYRHNFPGKAKVPFFVQSISLCAPVRTLQGPQGCRVRLTVDPHHCMERGMCFSLCFGGLGDTYWDVQVRPHKVL